MEQKRSRTCAATMRDVALQAGVSTATVSRALMRPEKVSPATLQRVRRAACSIGYAPLTPGRLIKRDESATLLALLPDSGDPHLSEVLRGIQETAAAQGYWLLLLPYRPAPTQKTSLSDMIYGRTFDGMLLLGADVPFRIDGDTRSTLPPMVMVNEYVPALALPTVHSDNLTAAWRAVDYLYRLGHRRIGCISGPAQLPACRLRLEGYRHALRRHGIAPREQGVFQGALNCKTGKAGLNVLISRPQPPTAIFCHSDMIALGALAQAKVLGLRVPEELSLTGFGNLTAAAHCCPPLTTVAPPSYCIGREAVLLLLRQLRQHATRAVASVMLDSELVIRGSSALPQTRH